MGTIVSATDSALGLYGQRSVAKTRSGVLWASVREVANARTRIWRSLNGGSTWTAQIVLDDAEAMGIRVAPGPDNRDWLAISYVLDPAGGTTTTVRAKVYRLFDDGQRPVEIRASIPLLESTSRQARCDVDAVTIGDSFYVQTVWSQDNGTNTAVYGGRTRWTTGDGFGPNNVGYLHHRNNTGGVIANPSVHARRVGLFPHSQPDFLVAWSQDHVSGGNEKKVYFLRLRNSGGGWVLENVQLVFQGGTGPVSSVWTGREHVTVAATDDEPAAVKAWFCGVTGANRFQADPPALAAGNIVYLSVAADPNTNDVWLLAAGTTDDVVKVVKYDRATDTWGTWSAVSADVLPDGRGNAIALAVGNVVDYVYTVSLGAPNTSVRSGTAAVTNRAPYQPVWQTAGGPYNRSASVLLDWEFDDPDGDAQAAFRLRRAQVIAGVQGSWSWWNGTGWQGTETHVTSASEQHTLPSGWAAADGDVWAFQVAGRDATLWSSYSATLYLTGSTPLTAAITAPPAGTVTAREFTVSWTPSAPGGALVEFLTGSDVVYDLRTTNADSVLVRPDITNDETYTLRVTLFSAQGVAGTPATRTVTMAWPAPPAATVDVNVAQRVDSAGRTVDAGLLATWTTAPPGAGQSTADTFDLYRYPVDDFAPGVLVALSAMTKVAAGVAPDGTFEDLSAPSDTLLAYVGVTIAADGTTQRSDEDVPAPPTGWGAQPWGAQGWADVPYISDYVAGYPLVADLLEANGGPTATRNPAGSVSFAAAAWANALDLTSQTWAVDANLGSVSLAGGYTVLCWIDGTDTDGGNLIEASSGSGPYLQWNGATLSGGHHDGTAFRNTTTTGIMDGNPHHVALTWDPADDIIRLYIDGVQVDSETAVTAAPPNLTTLRMGHNSATVDATTKVPNCLYGQVRVFTRALSTAPEIEAAMDTLVGAE